MGPASRLAPGSQLPDRSLTVSYIYAARYDYFGVVFENENQLRIFPRDDETQNVRRTQLWVLPQGIGDTSRDRFGNTVQRYSVTEHHTSLVVAIAGLVDLPFDPPALNDVSMAKSVEPLGATELTAPTPLIDPGSVSGLAREVAGRVDSLLETVSLVTGWAHGEVRYLRGRTSVATTAEQVASAREGVCQDKTHLAIGMLRALGIPCRYMSGILTGETGETHSWLEFMHPEDGWLGADPTRGMILPPARDYVRFAAGLDYTDVSPVSGSFVSTGRAREHAVISVSRFDEHKHELEDALELLKHAHVEKTGETPPDSS
jgi:transglutaminase-like putative cysteine protease